MATSCIKSPAAELTRSSRCPKALVSRILSRSRFIQTACCSFPTAVATSCAHLLPWMVRDFVFISSRSRLRAGQKRFHIVAGSLSAEEGAFDGRVELARFSRPTHMCFADSARTLYVYDSINARLRSVDLQACTFFCWVLLPHSVCRCGVDVCGQSQRGGDRRHQARR